MNSTLKFKFWGLKDLFTLAVVGGGDTLWLNNVLIPPAPTTTPALAVEAEAGVVHMLQSQCFALWLQPELYPLIFFFLRILHTDKNADRVYT